MLKISSSRGAPPSNPRALAGLVLRDSELAYLLRSLIKPSPPHPPPPSSSPARGRSAARAEWAGKWEKLRLKVRAAINLLDTGTSTPCPSPGHDRCRLTRQHRVTWGAEAAAEACAAWRYTPAASPVDRMRPPLL